MKIAFISDIHGNFTALHSVLMDIKKLKIKKIYCLGDMVNYYYEPHKCIDLLIKNNVISIKGNHEKILFETYKNKIKFDKYSKLYGNSIKINHKKLKEKHLKFLKTLSFQKKININGKKILLAHGAPWKNNFYFYPNVKKKWITKISKYKYDFIILGHTHIPMEKKLTKNKKLLNPGSIGQPRDKTCGASWMILDTDNMNFKILKTKYDYTKIIKQINKYDKNNLKISKYFKSCN
jgi:putative phosphoesterase